MVGNGCNNMDTRKIKILLREKIDRYIDGTITAKDASDWAQKIITSSEFENLPPKIKEAIHALFDLHDLDKDWVPSKIELLQYRNSL
jgi:hypothetical protein